MARGTFITDLDKIQIKLIAEKLRQTHGKISAESVRKEAERVTKRKYGRSTVHTIMAIKSEKREEFIAVEKVWTIGISANLRVPFPSHILPTLLKIQHGMAKGQMTIREAGWVNHLSSIFAPQTDNPEEVDRRLRDLWICARLYALYEHCALDSNVLNDTSPLDAIAPDELKTKALKWFKGKIPDELYKELTKGDGK